MDNNAPNAAPPLSEPPERPHGDKLRDQVDKRDEGKPDREKNGPEWTGNMDQPGMDPEGEDMPD
jgi:hypothetical protein